MDNSDLQHALLHKVIDLSLLLVEGLLHLRNILEPKPEYWIEFVEPFLQEMEERKKDVLERYRQKYGRQDVDDEACRRQVQEELDRMECQDDWQQVEQELQQQSTTHSAAAHHHCCSCRRRLEYDNIAIETDDDIMQHDNISS